jgi:tetratricopeptide (TPR) repeat protein
MYASRENGTDVVGSAGVQIECIPVSSLLPSPGSLSHSIIMSLLKRFLNSSVSEKSDTQQPGLHASDMAKPERVSHSNLTDATYLSLEREITRLQIENHALRRSYDTLQARLAPTQKVIDKMQEQIAERDRLTAQLANDIKTAVETYEEAISVYEQAIAVYENKRAATYEESTARYRQDGGYAELVDQIEEDLLTWQDHASDQEFL